MADAAPALLEREEELHALRELVAGAAEGRGGAAAVVGPAGIGKTSLLAAARKAATERGTWCCAARGGELEQDFPYGVVRQLFERPLRALPERERTPVLAGSAALAAPVLGLGRSPKGEPRDASFAVLHGLYWMCANLAERRPLLLAVDDLHWADAASLRFLAYLTHRVAELPLVLVVASRPTVEAAHPDLVDAVTEDPDLLRLAPSPLSAAGVGEMVAAGLDGDPDPAFVGACHRATAGNPFLCTALVATLADERVRATAGAAERVAELGGSALSGVVVRRLGRLPEAAAALARAASVLGRGAQLRHAAELAGLDLPATAAAADLLAAHGILRLGAEVEFVHPLVRTAVREDIPAGERGRLHERAARLLSADGLASEVFAAHLLAAPNAGDPWVVDGLRAAAGTASAQGDPGTAVTYLRRALREPPVPELQGTLMHELGAAMLHAGDPAGAVEQLERAEGLAANSVDRSRAARDLSLALMACGRHEPATAALERAIDGLRDRGIAMRLEAELHQSAMLHPATYTRLRDRFDRLEQELAGDTPGQRALLAAAATEVCLRTGDAAAVRELASRALAKGLLGDEGPYTGLWSNAAFPLVFADGVAEVQSVAEQAIDAARRRGSPLAAVRAHVVRAMAHLRRGSLRDAEADARAAIEAVAPAEFPTRRMGVGVLAETLTERGELEAAEALLADAGLAGDVPELFGANWALHARGWLRLYQGRWADAVADFEEMRRREGGWRPWNPGMFRYRAGLALALLATGDAERAAAIADEDFEYARRWGTPRAIGVALRTVAHVRGGERGLGLLRESVAALDGAGAPLELARSLLELGAALRRAGQRSAAREPLRAAMELAHHCGAVPLTHRAREELVATGARPRRVVRTGVDALTPSELRVARMAAAGMGNRDIAQALFVTRRTVEVHLTNSYRKLGVMSREELGPLLGP